MLSLQGGHLPYRLVIEPRSSQDPDLSLIWELDQNISKLNTANRILSLSNLENDAADMAWARMSFVKQAENSITERLLLLYIFWSKKALCLFSPPPFLLLDSYYNIQNYLHI